MSETFQPGDVVALKSGGHAMTINAVGTNIDGAQYAEVSWIDESGTGRATSLMAVALVPVTRRAIETGEGMQRYVWCFADGSPLADHIAMVKP